jgi:hypothetical protein
MCCVVFCFVFFVLGWICVNTPHFILEKFANGNSKMEKELFCVVLFSLLGEQQFCYVELQHVSLKHHDHCSLMLKCGSRLETLQLYIIYYILYVIYTSQKGEGTNPKQKAFKMN